MHWEKKRISPMATVGKMMVIGAGQMGRGIAQVAGVAGLHVVLMDLQLELAKQGLEGIRHNLERSAEKGQMSGQQVGTVLQRFHITDDLGYCRRADFVVEAAGEKLQIKQDIFRFLGGATDNSTILATNTSSLSITQIGAAANCAHRVIGMHFMNPVPKMQLVEVVRGLATAEATCTVTVELARRLGKKPVMVNDSPGFVSNRLLMPMINEAIFALYEGVADAKTIDAVMQLGMNHPMGPLALADLIGFGYLPVDHGDTVHRFS